MTGFRQQQAASTLTVPAARGLAPHFLVQPKHLKYNPPATEITIELYGFLPFRMVQTSLILVFDKNKNGYDTCSKAYRTSP